MDVKLGVPVPRARRGLYVLIEEESLVANGEGEVKEGRVRLAERVVEDVDLRARGTRWIRLGGGEWVRASGEG